MSYVVDSVSTATIAGPEAPPEDKRFSLGFLISVLGVVGSTIVGKN